MKTINIRKNLAGIFATAIVALNCLPAVTAYAQSGWNADTADLVRVNDSYEECIFVREGGTNTLDGITAENREETDELEKHLAENDYILVNGENSKLSDEEKEKAEAILGGSVVDKEYFDDKKAENIRVWVYKPSYETACRQYDEDGAVNRHIITELFTSTVVTDYTIWNTHDNFGKIFTTERINENILKYDEENGTNIYNESSGFIKIISPVDCKILLYSTGIKTYQELAVKGGEDLLVKIWSGTYRVADINSTEIDEKEETIVNLTNNFTNIFRVDYNNKEEENAVVIDLTDVIEKYSIAPVDISGEPDYQWKGESAVSNEGQDTDRNSSDNSSKDNLVKEDSRNNSDTETNLSEKESSNVGGIVVACVGAVAVIGGVGAFVKIKGKK